jgi:hypothetical protein
MPVPFREQLIVRACLLIMATVAFPRDVFGQGSGSTSSPGAGAPAAADSFVVGRERAMWEALRTQDTAAFSRIMGGGVVDVDLSGIKLTSAQSVARYVMGCQTASYSLSNMHVHHGATTAIVAYQAVVAQTCWGQKAPSPLFVLTVYELRNGEWIAVAHSETPATHS